MKNLYKKLLSLQREIKAIKRDETNPFFKSLYFDINGLLAELKPILNKHGLIVLQPLTNIAGKSALQTIVIDEESGEHLDSIVILPENSDPQKMGSMITYFRRYSLQSFLLLQAEDDDANIAVTPQNAPRADFKQKMAHTTTSAQTPAKNADKSETRLMFCPVCKVDAKVSQRTGKPYCPNFKKHPEGTFIPLEPKPSEREIQFSDSLAEPSQDEIDRVNMGL